MELTERKFKRFKKVEPIKPPSPTSFVNEKLLARQMDERLSSTVATHKKNRHRSVIEKLDKEVESTHVFETWDQNKQSMFMCPQILDKYNT